jgi:hypothetical protein
MKAFGSSVRCPILGSLFPITEARLKTLGGIIAPLSKPVLYSTLFKLQMTVCQQLATGRVSTTYKGENA